MYVIFPADELILMTYGAVLPRIKPRPTLDCLRDPLVATATSSSLSPIVQQTPGKALNSVQPQPQQKPPPSPRITQPPLMQTTVYDEPSNTRSTPNRYRSSSSTAIEPYGLNETPEAACEDSYLDDYGISRERSPSIYVESPSPDLSTSRPTTPSSNPKSPQTKTKTRPKLNISLGRLGRQQREQNESSRLREDLHLHVENPTFTRENLRQRNFDAFFESGEPVYKLHPRPASSTNLESESLSPQISFDGASGGYEPSTSAKPSNLGVFGRSKEPISSRSKSADYDSEKTSTGVPQKGDRFLGKIFKWSKRT